MRRKRRVDRGMKELLSRHASILPLATRLCQFTEWRSFWIIYRREKYFEVSSVSPRLAGRAIREVLLFCVSRSDFSLTVTLIWALFRPTRFAHGNPREEHIEERCKKERDRTVRSILFFSRLFLSTVSFPLRQEIPRVRWRLEFRVSRVPPFLPATKLSGFFPTFTRLICVYYIRICQSSRD